MDLLSFLDEGVVLGDSSEGELLHEVDLVRLDHVLLLEVLDDDWERGREEHHLPLWRAEAEQLLHDRLELWAEQLVGLVHHERRAPAQVGDPLAGEIEDSSRRSDEDVDGLRQSEDVVLEGGSSCGDHDVEAHVLSERLAHLRRLERELSRRHEDQRLDLWDLGVDLFQGRDRERSSLSGSVLGLQEWETRGGEGSAENKGDGQRRGDGALTLARMSLPVRATGMASS